MEPIYMTQKSIPIAMAALDAAKAEMYFTNTDAHTNPPATAQMEASNNPFVLCINFASKMHLRIFSPQSLPPSSIIYHFASFVSKKAFKIAMMFCSACSHTRSSAATLSSSSPNLL
jgi:hypothetical protein